MKEDPKSPVIWEAFKPETEPRRSIRRDHASAAQATAERPRARPAAAAAPRRPRPAARREAPAQPAPTDDFLQRQGGIY